MTKNFKTFDGKKYELEYRSENQSLINKLAKQLRESGRYVRIAKRTYTEYSVYKR